MCAEQLEAGIFVVSFGEQTLGVVQSFLGNGLLRIVQVHYVRLELVELVAVSVGRWAGNDQRRSGIVNQNGVYLIHNGEVVAALHQFFRQSGHVVPQVIKTKFVVGAERNVRSIGVASGIGIGLVLVYAVNSKSVELVQRTHPFSVALGQVVVHGNQVHAKTGQRIEVDGQGGNEGLALACGHFRDAAQVKNRATDQLHVVVHHVPLHLGARGGPIVVPYRVVAVDLNGIRAASQLAVHFGGAYAEVSSAQPLGGFADDRKGFGENFSEFGLCFVVGLFVQLVDLLKQNVLCVRIFFRLRACAQISNGGALLRLHALQSGTEFLSLGAKSVVVQSLNGRLYGQNAIYIRLDLLEVPVGLVPKE